MLRFNDFAWQIIQQMAEKSQILKCNATHLSCGSLIVDAGVNTGGSITAGLEMAKVATAGLADIRLISNQLNDRMWPYIFIQTDHPDTACYYCQSASWQVDMASGKGMGSGPACIKGVRDKIVGINFLDESDCAVLVLESSILPDEESCVIWADLCGVNPDRFGVVVAPTSSLAGSVQIAARSIETALHRLVSLEGDVNWVKSAIGICPMAQPSGDDWQSIGMTNDVIMFGSQVILYVDEINNEILSEFANKIPASTSKDYGKRFLNIFEDAGRDFYQIDPGIFAPAEITLINLKTGHIHQSGRRDDKLLRMALLK